MLAGANSVAARFVRQRTGAPAAIAQAQGTVTPARADGPRRSGLSARPWSTTVPRQEVRGSQRSPEPSLKAQEGLSSQMNRQVNAAYQRQVPEAAKALRQRRMGAFGPSHCLCFKDKGAV